MDELGSSEVRVGLYQAQFRVRAVSILGLDFRPSGFSVCASELGGVDCVCYIPQGWREEEEKLSLLWCRC